MNINFHFHAVDSVNDKRKSAVCFFTPDEIFFVHMIKSPYTGKFSVQSYLYQI